MNTIREMARAGKPVRAIAKELGLARNTVRKYVRASAAAAGVPRRKRKPSKLDPFKPQIRQWVQEDQLANCETIFQRLQALGYTGKVSILKDFVRPLRPPRAAGRVRPVIRYETKPGEQLQFDWGEFVYEQDGVSRKAFGFTAVLGYSRMRFVTFTKRTDAPTLLRCLLEAFEYFGGLPQAVLTDRMKTVLLDVADGQLHWHPQFADLMTSLGVTMRVCKPYTPQTKGKVERSVGLVKSDFWPGVRFTDLDDLNRQALTWCDALNHRMHRTTHQRPIERLAEEGLRPVPEGWVWERFAAEERLVNLEGYVSYDGVLYGLPDSVALVGRRVQVGERSGHVLIYAGGQLLLRVAKQPRSGTVVTHPTQFAHTPSAAAARRARTPVGHQFSAPPVAQRPLDEYDWLCGLVPTRAPGQPARVEAERKEIGVAQ